MQGNLELITVLNTLLADELTVINQYMVQSAMCSNWGYEILHKAIRNQGMDEMLHAEWLIERIIFFGSAPTVSKLNPMKIGKTVLEIINSNENAELEVVSSYNNAIKFAREVKDQGTADLLTRILIMEEGHVVWTEKQHAQIDQMGLENYLANQVSSQAI